MRDFMIRWIAGVFFSAILAGMIFGFMQALIAAHKAYGDAGALTVVWAFVVIACGGIAYLAGKRNA